MAERKGQDKFRVGQPVVFAISGAGYGWDRVSGELGVITGSRQVRTFNLVTVDGRLMDETNTGNVYRVAWAGGEVYIQQHRLRAAYEREPLSTWAEFAKVTGIDLPGSCIVAKPVRPKREARS